MEYTFLGLITLEAVGAIVGGIDGPPGLIAGGLIGGMVGSVIGLSFDSIAYGVQKYKEIQ